MNMNSFSSFLWLKCSKNIGLQTISKSPKLGPHSGWCRYYPNYIIILRAFYLEIDLFREHAAQSPWGHLGYVSNPLVFRPFSLIDFFRAVLGL